jgi:hypothetical protein
MILERVKKSYNISLILRVRLIQLLDNVSLFLARLTHNVEHSNDLDGYKLLLRWMKSVLCLNDARKYSSASDALNLVSVSNELAHLRLIVTLCVQTSTHLESSGII